VTPAWARDEAGRAVLEILVQPRASRTRVVGEHDGRLKIQVAAPPVEGEANAALIELVASALGVRRAAVSVLRGDSGRRKSVAVEGVRAERVAAALLTSASPRTARRGSPGS
jgi:uncharacterized protein (TIGR00251 family)